jgi:DNA helicase HerA-like ATPase
VSGNQSRDTEALEVGTDGEPVQRGDALSVVPPLYRAQTQAAGEEKIYLSNSRLNLGREVDTLGVRLRDRRFSFLFAPGRWSPDEEGRVDADLDALLESWLGSTEPVTIVDLSAVPPEVLHDVIGIMLRVVYDALYWGRDIAEGGRERPLLVVLEEAHAYLGSESPSLAGASVRRIVKEGRKYGVGAMIVSQRPSEVDHTVLSQCGTTFALRLSNSQDRAHVVSSVSNNLEGLLSMLPVLRTGEAIVIGEAVNLPMRVLVDQPVSARRPDSSDPQVFGEEGPGGWNKAREPEDYSELVELWRSQRSKSPKIVRSKEN